MAIYTNRFSLKQDRRQLQISQEDPLNRIAAYRITEKPFYLLDSKSVFKNTEKNANKLKEP